MLILLSPAKTMDFKTPASIRESSEPVFIEEADTLAGELRKLSPPQLSSLMDINQKLSHLNYERFQEWDSGGAQKKQAILAFKGEVYNGLKANEWNEEDLHYSQDHLRILSGLYGYLRPLDLIQPYRLEMGTVFSIGGSNNLYEFWRGKVTKAMEDEVRSMDHRFLVNLASREYSEVIDFEALGIKVITPFFKEYRNGKYVFITVYGKNARGMMVRWLIENRITDAEAIMTFDWGGYLFNREISKEGKWIFTR